jgi:hypothetical protein
VQFVLKLSPVLGHTLSHDELVVLTIKELNRFLSKIETLLLGVLSLFCGPVVEGLESVLCGTWLSGVRLV